MSIVNMSNLATQDKIEKIKNSTSQTFALAGQQIVNIEKHVEDLVEQGKNGNFKSHTVDVVPLRTKYFFGEGYTYGSQLSRKGPGMERLFPKGYVDPIPNWIIYHVIKPLIAANIIPNDYVNSVTVNDYSAGGCIVSHIDPPHLFDRPIISLSLFSDSTLCFGCKFEFKPIRCNEPIFKLALPRGIITILSGFAANEITHCVRPQDTKSHRAVILLRRVLEEAPRLNIDLSLDIQAGKPKFVDFTNSPGGKSKHCRKWENLVPPSDKILHINKKQFKKWTRRQKKATDIILKQNVDKKAFFDNSISNSKNQVLKI